MSGETGGAQTVRLLLFCEEGLGRELLGKALSLRDGWDVTAAGWNDRPAGRHDVALVSLVGQPEQALKTARRLAADGGQPAVVLLDRSLDRVHVHAARSMGAHGYWTLQDRRDAMLDGLRRAARGEECFGPGAAGFLRQNARRSGAGAAAGGVAGLAPRERQVLALLAQGATIDQCAARLGLAPKTVDNYKTRAMQRLGLHRQIELVRFANAEGLAGQ
jgi:DNA-binding NarL/FixJ family response regulator